MFNHLLRTTISAALFASALTFSAMNNLDTTLTVVFIILTIIFFMSTIWFLLNTNQIYQKHIADLTHELKEKQNNLIYNLKMSFMGEMAGGISHEINNPLAIIQGQTYLLKNALVSDHLDIENALGMLKKIETTTFRIAKIIRGLKAFSKTTENEPFSYIEIGQLIDNVLDLCSERFKSRGVILKLSLDSNFKLKCRTAEVVQVLLNILYNSYEAIYRTENPWIEINAFQTEDRSVITITDSGQGIKAEIAQKMMEPFFTTKEVGEGTGLGLSISKGIIEQHKGQLWFDASSPNTRFVIEFPKYKEIQTSQPLAN